MKVQSLKIRDFGIIDEVDFEFGSGIHLFTSSGNGQGKSTVMDALSTTLFNNLSGSLREYTRWGTQKPWDVRVDFSHAGEEYQTSVRYDSRKSASKRSLQRLKTGEVWENSAVPQKIDQIIDTRKALAATTCFQHDIDLIKTGPADRREYLKSIYNLDFRQQIEEITAELREQEDAIASLNSEISTLQNLEFETKPLSRLPLTRERREELEKEKDGLEKELEELKSDLQETERKIEEVKSYEEKRNQIEDKLGKKKQTLEEKTAKVEQIREALSSLPDEPDTTQIDEKLKTKMKELDTTLEKRSSVQAKKEELEFVFEVSRLEELVEEIESRKSAKSEITAEIRGFAESLEALKTGVCPTCGQECSPEHQRGIQQKKEEAESRLNFQELELEKKNEELQQLREQEKELEKANRELDSTTQAADSQTQTLEELKDSRLEEIEKEKKRLEERRAELESSAVRMDTDLEELREEMAALEKESAELTGFINSVFELRENRDSVETEIRDKKDKVQGITDSVSLFEKVETQNEEIRKFNEEQKAKQEQNERKIAKTERELRVGERNRDKMTEARKILRSEFPAFALSFIVSRLQNDANEFLQRTYPKYELVFRENKDGIDIRYGPEEADVKTRASGYEKQIFSLAYKYAIGKLQGYNILFLDEPDSAASDSNSEKFYRAVAAASEIFEQIFLISHKPRVAEMLRDEFGAAVYDIAEGKIQKIA